MEACLDVHLHITHTEEYIRDTGTNAKTSQWLKLEQFDHKINKVAYSPKYKVLIHVYMFIKK